MKNLFTFILLLVVSVGSSQDKKDQETLKTKMDIFSSKTGTILKFTDTNLPGLVTNYETVQNRIRKISSGNINAYFYQIVKEGKYGNSTASIEYVDLIEVIKAIATLKNQLEADLNTNPDYLENKFTTVDGFQIGYYITKNKAKWYLKLEKYGSDNTLFIDNGTIIEEAFNAAKTKVDEIKK